MDKFQYLLITLQTLLHKNTIGPYKVWANLNEIFQALHEDWKNIYFAWLSYGLYPIYIKRKSADDFLRITILII